MKRFILQQDTRRAAQRRLYAFELARHQASRDDDQGDPTQIAFAYTHVNQVEGRQLRRRIADLEYDDEV